MRVMRAGGRGDDPSGHPPADSGKGEGDGSMKSHTMSSMSNLPFMLSCSQTYQDEAVQDQEHLDG